MKFNREVAQGRLAALMDQPATGVGRALDMGVIEFGDMIKGPGSSSGSAFALHANCPFRLMMEGRILVGSEDMKWLAKDVMNGFAADDERSVYDIRVERIDEFFVASHPKVWSVNVSSIGDVRLDLEEDLVIEVFAMSSRSSEAWRFFHRYGEHYTFPVDGEPKET
ncbi:hypothetical protein [Sphaerimonospora thailandensis]|uniref:Uncharacterized protein n=1 Tax=Sphaerimonospora thailandensis TaxID=795644 RepID=A0A8J3VXQ7_9ACTN|nr:hypothetical protein [Sphaerimonospora thailandensis]GIH68150.1 hypothetical protein Mth01_04030 [Sphaerimonospora thailandensis]